MPNSRDDDIDDILSGIMHGSEAEAPHPNPKPEKIKSVKHSEPAKKPESNNVRRKKPRMLRYLLLLVVFVLSIVGVIFGVNKIAPDLLSPSPFNKEIKQAVDYPLYYPSKLPEGFKIETESIQQADQGVVIYAISDDNGKRITVSTQKMPEGIDLNKLYESLSDVYEIDTNYGKVKVGKDGNILIGNMNADGTWLLLNTPNGNVSTDEFNTVLTNIKKG